MWPGKGHETSKGPTAHSLSSNSDAPCKSEMTSCLQNVENGHYPNRIYDGQDHENEQSLLATDQKSLTPSSFAGRGVTPTSLTGNDWILEAPNTVVDICCSSGSGTSLQLSIDQSPVRTGSFLRDRCEKDEFVLNPSSIIHAGISNQYANGLVSQSSIGTAVPWSAGQSHERARHRNIYYSFIFTKIYGSHPDSLHDQSSFHLNSLSGMSLHISGGAANQALMAGNQDEVPALVPSSDLQDGLASIPYPLSFPEPSDLSSSSYPSYPMTADNVAVQGTMYAADSMPELNLLSGSGNGSDSEDSHSAGKRTQ